MARYGAALSNMRRHDGPTQPGLSSRAARRRHRACVDESHVWQMPQGSRRSRRGHLGGGQARALRGNQRSLGRSRPGPGLADLRHSAHRGRAHLKNRYRGQRQKWYAVRFTGQDAEINRQPGGGHKAGFVSWRWE